MYRSGAEEGQRHPAERADAVRNGSNAVRGKGPGGIGLSAEEKRGARELLRVIGAGGCVLEMSKALARTPRKRAEKLEEQGTR